MPCPDHPGHHIRCVVCEADNIAAADAARTDPRDARIAELEAQVAEMHASGLRLEFTHEWYVSGVRRAPGTYVLMRIGPAKDAEAPF